MISGDSKGVNVWFGSITSLGKGYNGHCTLWLPHRKCMVKTLISHKILILCQIFEQKDFKNNFSRSCSVIYVTCIYLKYKFTVTPIQVSDEHRESLQ